MEVSPIAVPPPNGSTLEHVVLSNSKQYFKSYSSCNKSVYPVKEWKLDVDQRGESRVKVRENPNNEGRPPTESDENSGCNSNCCWRNPNESSVGIAFCNETSIHGLKFMGLPKRHLTERVFWLVAFIASLSTGIYLIYGFFDRYVTEPVVVSFQSQEQDTDSIPFPAITFCNINKFPRSKVLQLKRTASDPSHPKFHEAKRQLLYVESVCSSPKSFAKEFDYAFHRGKTSEHSKDDDEINEEEIIEFIQENSLSCGDMIRLCRFADERRNCSALFKPVMTNYGQCCTFNILPLPLLFKDPDSAKKPDGSTYDNPQLGKNSRKFWPEEEIKLWKEWNYIQGFVLSQGLERPWRQKRAGLPFGLSVLVDTNVDEYYCPASDSYGLKFILHTPLEKPNVMEFASIAELNKEIQIEVHPDMINADNNIRDMDAKRRQCYFGRRRKLDFFGPYTGGNCALECAAKYFGKMCGCTYFYMPRDISTTVCSSDPKKGDIKCMDRAEAKFNENIKTLCSDCLALCNDIEYHYETTVADLQNSSMLWGDPAPGINGPPHWWQNKMSVLHIFLGSETTKPKYRKQLYGPMDLIANTGGILGLCLGFSILSAIEIIYFFTLRWFWKSCGKRKMKRFTRKKFVDIFWRRRNRGVIKLNHNRIPVYLG